MSEAATEAQQGDNTSSTENPRVAKPLVEAPKTSPNAVDVSDTADEPPKDATIGPDFHDGRTSHNTKLHDDTPPTLEDAVPPSLRDTEKVLNKIGKSMLLCYLLGRMMAWLNPTIARRRNRKSKHQSRVFRFERYTESHSQWWQCVRCDCTTACFPSIPGCGSDCTSFCWNCCPPFPGDRQARTESAR